MNQAVNNREQIKEIRRRMLRGEISYAEAKTEAEPIINAINAKAAELAKKYNMKAAKVSFAAMMR
jgi:hypothetical protein